MQYKLIVKTPNRIKSTKVKSLADVTRFLEKKKWAHELSYDQIYYRMREGKTALIAFKPWIMIKLKPLNND